MLLLPKLERTIKEFQQTIQVSEYNSVIERILRGADELAAERKMNLSFSFWDKEYSVVEDTDGTYRIRINRKAASGNRKELVYAMMHELGHWLDPQKLGLKNRENVKMKLDREMRAWSLADQQFDTHPELQVDLPTYTKYKNDCIATYIKRQEQCSD